MTSWSTWPASTPRTCSAPVLGAIGVTGTHAFTVDGALGADLDALRFDRLAAAFHDGAGIPLPTSPRQLLVDRAEDGTRWYLTDMTTMRHYQLVRTAAGIEVSVEAQIPRAPGHPDRHDRLPQGFYLNGALSILGIRNESTIEVDPGRGISIDSATDRIVIGSESLFVLEAAQGSGRTGPSLSMATYDQPRHPDERFRTPHVYINGDVGLLGLRRGLFVEIGRDGAAFELIGSLLPGAEFDLHGRSSGLTDFELGGSTSVGIGTIDLGPLGTISLATGATAAVEVSVTGTEITATLDATFTFAGEAHTAHVVLDLDAAPFASLVELLTDRVAAWFRDLFADAARWLGSVRDGALTLATSVGHVLEEQFGAAADAAAQLLKGAGWAVDEVAHELKEAFALGSTLARDALAGAGYAVDEVGAVMRSVFEWTDEIVQAAEEALDEFFQDVSDTFTDRRVTMVLLNRTGHRLRIEGARGESDQIRARDGLEIAPGGADEIGYFQASTGRWGWVDVRDVDDAVSYQAFIKEDSWFENATKTALFELRDNNVALPAGAVEASWSGSSTAAYVFDRVPAAVLRPPLSFPVGRRYSSPNGRATLVFQADGNLVVYDEQDTPRWYTNTVASGGGAPGATCVLQQDGNLVVYDAGSHPIWASHTQGHPDARLALQIDGNVALLADGRKALWSTGTDH
ncbi:MAG: hypothetical protein QOE59_2147 [Actinomycetota bacterium]|nr:hypothetical protein [Actinomycetota bacterium]